MVVGAVCPWAAFVNNSVIPIYRLIFLGILVLLLRRPPIIFAMHKHIHQIDEKRQALYVGFFGPIGVSAIFYLYVTLDFLRKITVNGEIRPDAEYLMEVTNIVVWFLCICSIVSNRKPAFEGYLTVQVIHGLSIPMGKLGFWIPRTLSRAVSSRHEDSPEPFHVGDRAEEANQEIEQNLRRRPGTSSSGVLPRQVYRIGRTLIHSNPNSASQTRASSQAPIPLSSVPTIASTHQNGDNTASSSVQGSQDAIQPSPKVETPPAAQMTQRSIRFPDEQTADPST